MSFDVLGDLNWPAVIVAGLTYFAVGGLWFAEPVFGKAWRRSIGWEMTGDQPSPGPAFYIGPLVTCLVAAVAVGMLGAGTGSDTFGEGICLGLVTGIGIAGAVLFVTGVFDPKKPRPMTWFGITFGYHLIGLLVASVIVSIWT